MQVDKEASPKDDPGMCRETESLSSVQRVVDNNEEHVECEEPHSDNNGVYATEEYPNFTSTQYSSMLDEVPVEAKVQGSSFFGGSSCARIARLSPLSSYSSLEEIEKLMITKLDQCCLMFDFNSPASELMEKELKRSTLRELVEFMQSCSINFLTDSVYQAIFNMVKVNAFRVFPYFSVEAMDNEEEDLYYEASWPHLSIVYDFLVSVLDSAFFNPAVACSYVNERYLSQFIDLFDSRDQRERDALRNVLHRLYSKLFPYRFFMRQYMSSVFLRYIYEGEHFNGIAQLLDILTSIIHGFALPLKDEHVTFLKRVLMPLHKGYSLHNYHDQLEICVIHFLFKDDTLTPDVIKYLIKYWPKCGSYNQVLAISELDRIMSVLRVERLIVCVGSIFKHVSKLIRDEHFQVVERAILLTKNTLSTYDESIAQEVIFQVYQSTYLTSKSYWNQQVSFLASSLLSSMQKINSSLCNTLELKISK